MITLRDNQKRQDKEFKDLIYGTREQKFCYYLGWNPNLYAGVALDPATINYINNYFYDYWLNPVEFKKHFFNTLQRVAPIYNNLKAVELNERIFDITTNKTARKILGNATNEVSKDGTKQSTKEDRGTIKDTSTLNESARSNGTESTTSEDSSNNRQATRQLPMQSLGTNFDQMFDWENGGSNATQSQDDSESDSRTTNNNTANSERNGTNIRTLGTTITKNDIDSIKELATKINENKEKVESINGQAVNLIRNIWDYLIEPKAIDYLVAELQKCFILVI